MKRNPIRNINIVWEYNDEKKNMHFKVIILVLHDKVFME